MATLMESLALPALKGFIKDETVKINTRMEIVDTPEIATITTLTSLLSAIAEPQPENTEAPPNNTNPTRLRARVATNGSTE